MTREIIAILRGLVPSEALEIGKSLIDAGISRIEVPLNSPQPFESIGLLAKAYGAQVEIGAGTVLKAEEVHKVAGVGGKLIVSPDCCPEVIQATKSLGLASYAGVLTPTECFTALRHGADGLKFFPSFLIGPAGLKAILAVLPVGTKTYAVGAVGPNNFASWLAAGVTGFGVGSSLFQPGLSADDVGQRARSIVLAYDNALHFSASS